MHPLEVDYHFSNIEKAQLEEVFLNININPYKDFIGYHKAISDLAGNKGIPEALLDIAQFCNSKDGFEKPFIYLKNCPLDAEKPVFDFSSPVESKYALKKTFVAEGFLSLFAVLTGMHPLRYAKMNNGDAFHDIFPMEKMSKTLSQKSLVSLGHHQDFPIHFARPRWVNMITMRNPAENRVYTTFAQNKDILERLSRIEKAVLEQKIFHTPYDDVTKNGDKTNTLDDKDGVFRAIKVDQMLNYYEGRTVTDDHAGKQAIEALNQAIADTTTRVQLVEGDFICFDNERSLHGRDVAEVCDPKAHKTRWLIKSHTAKSIVHLTDHLIKNRPGVVNG